ncbi:Josephin-1 [Linnemannia elongata]|nr:Josephin-1 [Linnemannia elongata]
MQEQQQEHIAQINSTRSLYHECQNHGQCGKHTLNNLLQGPVYSIADLDVIAEDLRKTAQESLQKTIWKNPYKSPMGMGYYDVSVLEAALNKQHCTLAWFDARRDIAESLTQQDDSMVGLIVHVPTSPRWVPFWKGQHWFGILRLSNGAFVNLDSRLSQPMAFAGFDDTIEFLNEILQNDGRLFFIHRDTVESKEQQHEEKGSASGTVAPEPIATVVATGEEVDAS